MHVGEFAKIVAYEEEVERTLVNGGEVADGGVRVRLANGEPQRAARAAADERGVERIGALDADTVGDEHHPADRALTGSSARTSGCMVQVYASGASPAADASPISMPEAGRAARSVEDASGRAGDAYSISVAQFPCAAVTSTEVPRASAIGRREPVGLRTVGRVVAERRKRLECRDSRFATTVSDFGLPIRPPDEWRAPPRKPAACLRTR